MVHVKNDPKVNNKSVGENPANESSESISETIDENNLILPRHSPRATETRRQIWGRTFDVSNSFDQFKLMPLRL